MQPYTAKTEFDKELLKDKKVEIVDPEVRDKSIETQGVWRVAEQRLLHRKPGIAITAYRNRGIKAPSAWMQVSH